MSNYLLLCWSVYTSSQRKKKTLQIIVVSFLIYRKIRIWKNWNEFHTLITNIIAIWYKLKKNCYRREIEMTFSYFIFWCTMYISWFIHSFSPKGSKGWTPLRIKYIDVGIVQDKFNAHFIRPTYLFIFTNELGLIYSKILQIGYKDLYPCLAFLKLALF